MGDDTVRACLHCNSSSLRHHTRSGGSNQLTPQNDPHYVCTSCNARVDEPVERERRKRKWSGHEKLMHAGFGHLLGDGGGSE